MISFFINLIDLGSVLLVKIQPVNQERLLEKGRLQYFYHSPASILPIRDVTNLQNQGFKTEPHIEIGAENYWARCYQDYIKSFANSDEKYLFLFTNCQSKELKEFQNKRFIVGYIVKEITGEISPGQQPGSQVNGNNSRTFIKGTTYLYSFEDSLPLDALGLKKFRAEKKLDLATTQKILNHFNGKKNILNECINEIKRLDKNNQTCYKTKFGKECQFSDQCLRWK